jgi:hypothetical protein
VSTPSCKQQFWEISLIAQQSPLQFTHERRIFHRDFAPIFAVPASAVEWLQLSTRSPYCTNCTNIPDAASLLLS